MSTPRQISVDARSLCIDGQPHLLLSGAIHYPRSLPDQWPLLFRRSREAGLNAIETYAFWNLHEARRGIYDFSGRLDLAQFCRLAQDEGLDVIVRLGPYVCAEVNYGGLPAWLREVPGIAMRTTNDPFQTEMSRWIAYLGDYLRPLTAPQGGPIILAQIENEYNLIRQTYGKAGQNYLTWASQLGKSLELGVPWIMCLGAADDAIETINGFYGHKDVDDLVARRPHQPLIWTEDWTGWYDTWGYPHHLRSAADSVYATARFIAAGGTGINYYMWHGGTNLGREAMYLQTTSYDYDAPLDEFGRHTTKSRHTSRFNALLHRYTPVLLSHQRAEAVSLGPAQRGYQYGALAFLCNDDDTAANVLWFGHGYELAPRSVTLVDGDTVVFRTDMVAPEDSIMRHHVAAPMQLGAWQSLAESLPAGWAADLLAERAITNDAPIEQLRLTHDTTDYCWYETTLIAEGPGTLRLAGVGDMVQIFIDGVRVATSALPLREERGPLDGPPFTQTFALDMAPGTHTLSLLCAALGLIKGDWMVGHTNMAAERKGLWGAAFWNDHALTGWRMVPGLVGEAAAYPTAEAAWADAPSAAPLCWWRTTFDLAEGQADDAPLVLDLAGMGKGLAWLNGHCIGRYWLIPATGTEEPLDTPAITEVGQGEPTQRYYHLPTGWLRTGRNVVVLFDELGGDPSQVRLMHVR